MRGLLLGLELPESPLGVFGDEGVVGCGQFFQRRAEFFRAGVAHGDGDIAQEAAVLGAGDRGAAEHGAEFGLR